LVTTNGCKSTERLVEINEAYRMLRTVSLNDLDEKEVEPPPPADEPIDWTPVAHKASSTFSPYRSFSPLDEEPRSRLSFEMFKGKGYYLLVAGVVVWLVVMTLMSR
jgi:hypothetical protein